MRWRKGREIYPLRWFFFDWLCWEEFLDLAIFVFELAVKDSESEVERCECWSSVAYFVGTLGNFGNSRPNNLPLRCHWKSLVCSDRLTPAITESPIARELWVGSTVRSLSKFPAQRPRQVSLLKELTVVRGQAAVQRPINFTCYTTVFAPSRISLFDVQRIERM